PTTQTEPPHVIEDEAGERTAYHIGDRYPEHQQRDGLRLFAFMEPICQVQEDSGKVSRFGQTEHEARDIKLLHVAREPAQRCDHPPHDQNASNPDARAKSVEREVAWNLEQRIADKKNADEEPELPAVDRQFPVHRQRGEPDVDAIEEGNDVEEQDERKDPTADFPDRLEPDQRRIDVRSDSQDDCNITATYERG